MLTIQYMASFPYTEAALLPLFGNHSQSRGRRRLRLYLVGSETDTQQTVDYLHVRGCIERIEWSHAIAIPENGIVIRRDPGDVLRYLQRDGRRTIFEDHRQFD